MTAALTGARAHAFIARAQYKIHGKLFSKNATAECERGIILIGLCFALFVMGSIDTLYGHEGETGASDADKKVPLLETLGMTERTGEYLPLDTKLLDEYGKEVSLSEMMKGPTILTFTYYRCKDQCSLLVSSIARLLRVYTDEPGRGPNLVTVSINDLETPADAMEAKRIAFEIIEKPYPQDKWHFLTGRAESIRALTDAAGFGFTRRGTDFDHPLGLIILTPKGRISRYILGTDYLAADLTISLMEADSGTLQPTIARILRLCFSYDPSSRKLVFNTLQVSAVVILTLAGLFVLYLVLSTTIKRRKGAV